MTSKKFVENAQVDSKLNDSIHQDTELTDQELGSAAGGIGIQGVDGEATEVKHVGDKTLSRK